MKQDVAEIMMEVSTGKERLQFKVGDEVENFCDNVRAVELIIMEINDKMNSEISKLKDQSLAGSLTSNGSAINAEVGRDTEVRIVDVGPITPPPPRTGDEQYKTQMCKRL
jgi:hypothetical protein